MIEIAEVPLDITLPDHELRLVMMQPFLALNSDSEPFVWIEDRKDAQIAAILRTLEIARQSETVGGAHFTLIPEYSIPGLSGVEAIEEVARQNSWQRNSIIIGGVDGLTKEQYQKLCNVPGTQVHLKNSPNQVGDTQWVNCSITWAKESDGTLKRWVQPKFSPSWPEGAITAHDMFTGKAFQLFAGKFENTTDCRFMSLICFDWIGSQAGSDLLWEALKVIDNASNRNKKDLNLMFVLQHNPKPNHHTFLENTRRYFEEQKSFPFTVRIQGAVVFANTAGGERPGTYPGYGFSSVIFSPLTPYESKACPPSAAVVTKKLRASESLGRCKESLLRESGACIHSIWLTLPQFINLGPDRTLPIKKANVHSLALGMDDVRTPDAPVPAIVKWINDQIDSLPCLTNKQLQTSIEESQLKISSEFRRQSYKSLLDTIDLATYLISTDKQLRIPGGTTQYLVDNWDNSEREILRTIIQTLSVVHLCQPLVIPKSPGHAVFVTKDQIYDVVIVRGETHQEGLAHAKKKLVSSGQRIRIIVTQDQGDTILLDRGSITVAADLDIFKGPKITDPESSWRHCGHQNIVSACCSAQTMPELNKHLTTLLKL